MCKKLIYLTFFCAFCTTAMASDVAISTQAGWFAQAAADREMQEIVDNVTDLLVEVFPANEQDALAEADFILSATPQGWKKLLRKENKFVTDFMLGRIKLEHGSKVGVLSLAPHSNTVIDALTQVEIQFPDEMSEDELIKYRSYMEAFRAKLNV